MHSKLGKPQHHYSLASHAELETFREEHNSEAGTLVSPGMEARSLYPLASCCWPAANPARQSQTTSKRNIKLKSSSNPEKFNFPGGRPRARHHGGGIEDRFAEEAWQRGPMKTWRGRTGASDYRCDVQT
jgi:hypothetical protein